MTKFPVYNQHYVKLHGEYIKMVHAKGYACANDFGSSIKEFFFFLEQREIGQIKEVKAKDVIAYYEYLKERPNELMGGGLSDARIRSKLYQLRLLFDYLVDTRQIEDSPVNLPKFQAIKYQHRNIATVEEIKLIYKATVTRLDRAILALAYGCGLRKTEIELTDLSDVQLSRGMLLVKRGKGNKTRKIPMSDTVIRDLREYIANERTINYASPMEVSSALLISRKGERMKQNRIAHRLGQLVAKTCNRSLLRKNITLHCLRHSIATHLIDNGMSIEFVRQFLGHTMLDTTHLYSRKRKQRLLIQQEFERAGKAA
jgi:integrase/recombinase XerD